MDVWVLLQELLRQLFWDSLWQKVVFSILAALYVIPLLIGGSILIWQKYFAPLPTPEERAMGEAWYRWFLNPSAGNMNAWISPEERLQRLKATAQDPLQAE